MSKLKILTLHRIIKVNNDGTLDICGDNQYYPERSVTGERVIAKVSAIAKGGTVISLSDAVTDRAYRSYLRRLCTLRPLRRIKAAIARRIK